MLRVVFYRLRQSSARLEATANTGGSAMNRPRAADDFVTIRACMEEVRQEREGTKPAEPADAVP